MTKSIEFAIAVSRPEPSVHDARIVRHERAVMVEESGHVLAYDEVAGHYSVCHNLTEADVAAARELADKVRAGTHYVIGSRVYPRPVAG